MFIIGVRSKTVSGIMLTLLLTGMLIFTFNIQPARTEPDTIIVPDDYSSIQEAIDAASEGDRIFVRNGTYYENVVINKSVALVGEDKENTIIDGARNGLFGPTRAVIAVIAMNVLISNLTIRNSGNQTSGDSGIHVRWYGNSVISNNILMNNSIAITIESSSNITIVKNILVNNHFGGVLLMVSQDCYLSGNDIQGNKSNLNVLGLSLSDYQHSIDDSNLVNGKPIYYFIDQRNLKINSSSYPNIGYLALVNCSNIEVQNLTLGNNGAGILFAFTENSRIISNYLANGDGIGLSHSSNNSIIANNLINNGISISGSNNVISQNTFVNCGMLCQSKGNKVNDNLVNGKPLVFLEDVSNYTIENAGQVILIDCISVLVENLDLSNATSGVFLLRTNNTRIADNKINNNIFSSVFLSHSSNCTIYGNTISNSAASIFTSFSSNNQIAKNTISDCGGMLLGYGSSISISENNITNNMLAINIQSAIADVQRNLIANNDYGIMITGQNNLLKENTLSGNFEGVTLEAHAYNNKIILNNFVQNVRGISLGLDVEGNHIYHNNFVENEVQVSLPEIWWNLDRNYWDNGYPYGGNYWSDYNCTDIFQGSFQNETGSDGIMDTASTIAERNMDKYPLAGTFSIFNATSEHHVQTICNSTISDFQYFYFPPADSTVLSFNVTGVEGTSGFCRICIPTALITGPYRVLVNGTEIPFSLLPFSNSTHSYLYFTYEHSTKNISIIPEFSSLHILPLFMIATFSTIAYVWKRKR